MSEKMDCFGFSVAAEKFSGEQSADYADFHKLFLNYFYVHHEKHECSRKVLNNKK
jgi:hypothetical protein